MKQKNLPSTTICIQENDFDAALLLSQLHAVNPQHLGAVVSFTGVARSKESVSDELELAHSTEAVEGLYLEHYSPMTEKALAAIIERACVRWPVLGVVVYHRIGYIRKGEQIVFVGVSASHRKEAFEACSFIMDYLKMEAPFWKKECMVDGSERWVDAKDSDKDALSVWS